MQILDETREIKAPKRALPDHEALKEGILPNTEGTTLNSSQTLSGDDTTALNDERGF